VRDFLKFAMTLLLENLHWLGHSSFRWQGKKIIYFDPWKLAKGSRGGDIILISHEHFDHFSLGDIMLISSKDTVIVTSREASKQLQAAKLICKEIKSLTAGESSEIGGTKISAVASYNTNKQFHTRDSGKLGFIVSVDGVKIYHAGDTDIIPEMKNFTCDIALLPVSGTYVMTADEAANAALAIRPKIAIPMHYGDIVGNDADAKRLRDLLKGKVEVKILEKEK